MEDYRAQLERGVGYVSKPVDGEGPTRIDLPTAKDKRIAELEDALEHSREMMATRSEALEASLQENAQLQKELVLSNDAVNRSDAELSRARGDLRQLKVEANDLARRWHEAKQSIKELEGGDANKKEA